MGSDLEQLQKTKFIYERRCFHNISYLNSLGTHHCSKVKRWLPLPMDSELRHRSQVSSRSHQPKTLVLNRSPPLSGSYVAVILLRQRGPSSRIQKPEATNGGSLEFLLILEKSIKNNK